MGLHGLADAKFLVAATKAEQIEIKAEGETCQKMSSRAYNGSCARSSERTWLKRGESSSSAQKSKF
jgi:hypothetical protein